MNFTKTQLQAVKRNLAARPSGRPVPRWFIALTWDISEKYLRKIEATVSADNEVCSE